MMNRKKDLPYIDRKWTYVRWVRFLPRLLIITKMIQSIIITVYPKKYTYGFCFAVLCCGYTLTDFPISIRLTSLALWQSNDCPSASKATLMNMDKYFMWIHYEWLHNHNKAKHNKTVCIFLGIYCTVLGGTATATPTYASNLVLALRLNHASFMWYHWSSPCFCWQIVAISKCINISQLTLRYAI